MIPDARVEGREEAEGDFSLLSEGSLPPEVAIVDLRDPLSKEVPRSRPPELPHGSPHASAEPARAEGDRTTFTISQRVLLFDTPALRPSLQGAKDTQQEK